MADQWRIRSDSIDIRKLKLSVTIAYNFDSQLSALHLLKGIEMKFKVFTWVTGLVLIFIFGFKAVFSYLYILGLINPAPDFPLLNTINLIDRAVIASVIVLSGVFIILRKKL